VLNQGRTVGGVGVDRILDNKARIMRREDYVISEVRVRCLLEYEGVVLSQCHIVSGMTVPCIRNR
jgi:hypothetical protein